MDAMVPRLGIGGDVGQLVDDDEDPSVEWAPGGEDVRVGVVDELLHDEVEHDAEAVLVARWSDQVQRVRGAVEEAGRVEVAAFARGGHGGVEPGGDEEPGGGEDVGERLAVVEPDPFEVSAGFGAVESGEECLDFVSFSLGDPAHDGPHRGAGLVGGGVEVAGDHRFGGVVEELVVAVGAGVG